MRFGKMLGLAGALVLAAPSAAWADGFQSWKICGGSIGSFTTCAAVQVTVIGSDVSMRVWNLSGNSAATYGTTSNAGAVFTGIGFYNIPAGVDAVTNSLTMNGPARAGNHPSPWTLKNNGRVDFIVDIAGTAAKNGTSGIASGCATSSQLPGSPPQLFQTPCNYNSGNSAGWVNFNFKISGGTWDPTKSDVVIRAQDFVNGTVTECRTGNNPTVPGSAGNCTTVTPEPVSMALLATGLAGMGGMGLIRRKKKNLDV